MDNWIQLAADMDKHGVAAVLLDARALIQERFPIDASSAVKTARMSVLARVGHALNESPELVKKWKNQ